MAAARALVDVYSDSGTRGGFETLHCVTAERPRAVGWGNVARGVVPSEHPHGKGCPGGSVWGIFDSDAHSAFDADAGDRQCVVSGPDCICRCRAEWSSCIDNCIAGEFYCGHAPEDDACMVSA